MQIDPHTLQLILERIQQQLRCPQCGKRIPADFTTVRVVDDQAILLQIKCETCNAYIVLHATLQGVEHLGAQPYAVDATANASSSMELSVEELQLLRESLDDGKFEKLFRKPDMADGGTAIV